MKKISEFTIYALIALFVCLFTSALFELYNVLPTYIKIIVMSIVWALLMRLFYRDELRNK